MEGFEKKKKTFFGTDFSLSTHHLAIVLQERAAAGDVVNVQHHHYERPETGKRAGNRSEKSGRGAGPIDLRKTPSRGFLLSMSSRQCEESGSASESRT